MKNLGFQQNLRFNFAFFRQFSVEDRFTAINDTIGVNTVPGKAPVNQP